MGRTGLRTQAMTGCMPKDTSGQGAAGTAPKTAFCCMSSKFALSATSERLVKGISPAACLFALDAGVLEGDLDAGGDPEAVRARIRHVVRIACDSAAHVLRQNVCAARLQPSRNIQGRADSYRRASELHQ